MKYPTIDNKLFIENRKRFTALMKPGSIAIVPSNYEFSWNGDASHKFKQNSDLFWLSGIDQEDSYLMIFPDCPIPEYRECLFLKETNDRIAIWEGHKYSRAEATETSGIGYIFWNQDLMNQLRPIINMAENIYLSLNENDRFQPKSPYKSLDFAHELQQLFPLHHYERAGTMIQRLRSLKSDAELALTRHAIGISKKGFERLLRFVKPGVWEYEIEAELIHEYLSNRAIGHSFDPIVATGGNACVLHYVANNCQVKDGDLILVDCGVDYANYASDMTRCIPANGRF
jgi:Xaa-Pro aminopeptidase